MNQNAGRILAVVLVASILLPALPSPAAEESAHDLVKKALAALPAVPFAAKLSLTTDLGAVRQIEVKRKVIDGARSSYLEVVEPEDLRGIRFLFIERPGEGAEQYIKVKASRRILLVADQMRTQPFLGSTFYVSDVVEPELETATYTYLGEEQVGGRKCKLVQSMAKNPGDEVYGKTVAAIDPVDALVMRREFFDHDGNLFKVWSAEKVEKVDGYWTIRKQFMTNVQEQTHSMLEILEIKYDAEIPDEVFTRDHLRR